MSKLAGSSGANRAAARISTWLETSARMARRLPLNTRPRQAIDPIENTDQRARLRRSQTVEGRDEPRNRSTYPHYPFPIIHPTISAIRGRDTRNSMDKAQDVAAGQWTVRYSPDSPASDS